jgi:hypothetical protein
MQALRAIILQKGSATVSHHEDHEGFKTYNNFIFMSFMRFMVKEKLRFDNFLCRHFFDKNRLALMGRSPALRRPFIVPPVCPTASNSVFSIPIPIAIPIPI